MPITEKMRIEMREAKKDDCAELQELFCSVHGFKPTTEYMRWKFDDNPAGAVIRVVAETEGKIVGQYVLWPTYLQLGEEKILGAQSLDTIVHPDYQGMGLFTKLAEKCMNVAAQRGIEVFYGFPNKNSYPGFIKYLNWDHVGDIPMWFRPITPSLHGRMPRIIGPFADMGAIIIPSGSMSHSITITSSSHIPPEREIEPLFQLPQGQRKCRILRSYDWLKWRFSEDSGLHYEWLSAHRNGEMAGYMVWAVKETNRTGIISDIIGNDQTTLETLISAAVRRAKSQKCSFLTTVTNIQPTVKALRNCGFMRYKNTPLITRKMTVRTLGGNIHHFPAWKIIGGDLDTY